MQLNLASSAIEEIRQRATSRTSKMVCREIRTTDTEGVIELATRGFSPARSRDFWVNAFARLSAHPTHPGLPQFGYLLERAGAPVGMILLIITSVEGGEGPYLQCNVSSWYVEPAYRMFGTMLISHALKHKQLTYINITPAPHTWDILKAQGYRQYCNGRVTSVPAFCRGGNRVRVEAVKPNTSHYGQLSPTEIKLLQTHAGYGCISLICHHEGGSYPFVFAPRKKYGVLPFVFLIYCRDVDTLVRCAGPIGRFLALRGLPLMIVDADGPVPGLVGRYSNTNPKFFRGPHRPRLGNLSYTERAMFGV